jgi:hypothetical protein
MAQLTQYGIPGELPAVMPPAKPLQLFANVNQLIYGGLCILRGWSLRNSGGSTDTVQILDGSDVNGMTVGWSHNATLGVDTQNFGDSGIICRTGLFVKGTQGNTIGAFWVIPL